MSLQLIIKIFALGLISLNGIKSYSQEISMKDFEYIVLRENSINGVEHGMKQYGYEFNNAKDEVDDSGKIYTVSSFLKKLPNSTVEEATNEIILWQEKNSPFRIEMLEFHTTNEKKYFAFKTQIDTNKNCKMIIDKIEDNCIKAAYTDRVLSFFFQNCTDENGRKLYQLTILNLLFFPPLPK